MISTMLIQLELPFIGSDLIISEKKKLYYVVWIQTSRMRYRLQISKLKISDTISKTWWKLTFGDIDLNNCL